MFARLPQNAAKINTYGKFFFAPRYQPTADTSKPIFILSLIHLNLKRNLEIPNRCLYNGNNFGNPKIDKITFQTGVYILYSSEICVATE